MVTVYLRVRFRAFGVTFGTVEQEWQFDPLTRAVKPVPGPLPPVNPFFSFNERGVTLLLAA